MPGRLGMVSGLFFGFAFGMGGLGAAALGRARGRNQHHLRLSRLRVPARTRLLTALLPDIEGPRLRRARA